MTKNEQRLEELESRIAFQDDLLDQLNQALIEQQRQLTELKATCKLLYDRLNQWSNDGGADPAAVEIPPHY